MSAREVVRRFLAPETMAWAENGMESVQTLVLTVDSLYSLIIGLMLYCVPQFIGDFVFQMETDGVHWHLIRCLGAQVLSIAYLNFRLRESHESAKSIPSTIRMTSSIIIIMLVVQCITHTPELVYPWKLGVAFIFCGAMIILYGAFMMWNGWPVGSHVMPENVVSYEVFHIDRIGLSNMLFQMDSISHICVGLFWFSFPGFLLYGQVHSGLDESHEVLGRLLGTFFMATFANGMHALHLQAKDRLAIVESRAICDAGILGAQVWSQIAYVADWNRNHWAGITIFSVWVVLSTVHYLIHPSAEGEQSEKAAQKKAD